MKNRHRSFVFSIIPILLFSVPITANNSALTGGQATALTTELVATGFNKPVYLTSIAKDTSRLFIVEQQSGLVKIIKNGIILSRPFLDISDRVNGSGFERGLFSIAFHPEFESNRFFYVNYTNSAGDLAISRFEVSATEPDSADASSEFNLLTIPEPEANHNGGIVMFGPNDGYLYIAVGDGGGAGDVHGTIGNGQDVNTLLGKVLRIDVDGGIPYSIPPANPFICPDSLDEIWASGLRNPWRMSFDRLTGDLYIADVGQGSWEEINFQSGESIGGENYGWRLKEGFHCYNPPTDCDPGGLTDPITEYSHTDGCSITGGYVYRGCAIPDLKGTYFYADWCNGRIWSFRYENQQVVDSMERTTELAPGGGNSIDQISSFGEDARGEMYILDHSDGEVYRIIPVEPVESECGSDCCQIPGDSNHDGVTNVGDIVHLSAHIFQGGPPPVCRAESDTNADCSINIGDMVFLINRVFNNGPAPNCGGCS
jgi:glucose/arabinose dehydrogenase